MLLNSDLVRRRVRNESACAVGNDGKFRSHLKNSSEVTIVRVVLKSRGSFVPDAEGGARDPAE